MDLEAQFSNITDYFSPKVITEVNDQYVKVAKIKGQKVPWHNHQNEDELFYRRSMAQKYPGKPL